MTFFKLYFKGNIGYVSTNKFFIIIGYVVIVNKKIDDT